MTPVAALCLVAGLTAACGAASTPLEVYQNCLRCGYDFKQPIPTAAAELNRARTGYPSAGADAPAVRPPLDTAIAAILSAFIAGDAAA
jgi:hypothetical protein